MPTSPVIVPYPGNEVPRPGVQQIKELPNTRKPGQTGIYQNAFWGLRSLEGRPFKTLVDAWDFNFDVSKNKPFLGHRPVVSTNPLKFSEEYVWETYGEIDERRRRVGSALEKLFRDGKLGKAGELDTVGLWMANRPEWRIVDLAAAAYNKVVVGLFDALNNESIQYIINHAFVSIMFTTSSHTAALLSMTAVLSTIKIVVVIDDILPATEEILKAWGDHVGVEIWKFKDFENFGEKNKTDIIPASMDQIASICYTSGTNGPPKGAVITHANLMASADAFSHGGNDIELGSMISYLPLAHIYERIMELLAILHKNRIGYSTGDPLRLLEDAQILKPTFFPLVPRLINRIYQMVSLAAADSGLKGHLLKIALETKIKNYREHGILTHALWDRLVFNKIRALLGGRVELLTNGSALLSGEVMDTLKVAFCCKLTDGEQNYGLTETCAVGVRTWPWDNRSAGTIGSLYSHIELKLVDVPELGYTSDDKPNPRGEICFRGGSCISSYYKNESATRSAIDNEGWFHTGDIGEIGKEGRVIFIDRKMNVMKLAQGEYVALDRIQNVYSACPFVAQLYVHGDALKSYLVAVIVPDNTYLLNIAKQYDRYRRLSENDREQLNEAAKDTRVIQYMMKLLDEEAKKADLKGFEKITNIFVTLEPFTIENGLLTPTFKIKRREVAQKYKMELDKLYSESSATPHPIPKL